MPWALERLEVCELTEFHLLIVVNLGKLVIFMEKKPVREEEPLISSPTVNTVLEQHRQNHCSHGQTTQIFNLE